MTCIRRGCDKPRQGVAVWCAECSLKGRVLAAKVGREVARAAAAGDSFPWLTKPYAYLLRPEQRKQP